MLAGVVLYKVVYDEETSEDAKLRGSSFPGMEGAKYHAAKVVNSTKFLVRGYS